MIAQRVLLACCLATVLWGSSSSGADSWLPVGPPGGDVRSLAVDPRNPQRLYLGTADGVLYRSEDQGLIWRRLLPGFPERGKSLDEIVVDEDGVVWVGHWQVEGQGGGVARSEDGGQTFTQLPGMRGESVRALVIAPSNPRILVAGSLSGVFRSVDGGRSWRRISPEGHIDLKNVESLAVDPRYPGLIYAGTWHLPWRTADAGRTWYPVSTGMINDSDVMSISLDRRNPQIIYATACSGMYRSADGAARWTKLRGVPSSSRRTRAFAQSPDDPATFYAGTTEGLWVSRDGGAGWQLATSKEVVVNAIVALPGGTVLLGGDGFGVLRSADGARSFTASNEGFSERFVSRIVFDGEQGALLVGIWGDRQHGGVFRAKPSSRGWERLGQGLEGREVLSLASREGRVVAGTDDGLFVLTKSAPAWVRLPVRVGGIDVHPRVTDVALLPEGVILAATSRGLLAGSGGGETWKRAFLGAASQATALAVSARDPRVVLAATPLGFFKSKDGGQEWEAVSQGLEAPPHSLAFLPTDDQIAFAATPKGLFRSRNQGRTWVRVTGGVPFTDITGLAVHPDGRTLYAGDFTAGGIFHSADGGETWKRLPSDGLLTERAWTLAVDPSLPGRVFVSSPTGGLHVLGQKPAAVAGAGSR
jgi:photosystem II stability/assembly factor-like uncharacterized protein